MPHECVFSAIPEMEAMQRKYGYADAAVAGGMVYLSGVVAFRFDDESEGQLEPGIVRAFERLGATLRGLGLDWQNVVAIDTFHLDRKADGDIFKEVKNRYIAEPFPAWTAIGTTDLGRPNAIVEIKLTAWRG